MGGVWTIVDTNQYTAYSAPSPEITVPVDGSTLTGSTATVQWNANGVVPSLWVAHAGSAPGTSNYVVSTPVSGSATQQVLNGLPTNGETVYVTLYKHVGGVWTIVDTNQYTAYSAPSPEITVPVDGSTLTGSTATVQWNANGVVPSLWVAHAGSAPGTSNYVVSTPVSGSATQQVLNGLPTNGETVYVTLYKHVGGVWTIVDTNQYTASGP